MNEYPHGTVFIFKTTGALPAPLPKGDELGVKMVFISGDTDLIGVVYPEEVSEGVARPMGKDEFFNAMFREPDADVATDTVSGETVKVPDDLWSDETKHQINIYREAGDLIIKALDGIVKVKNRSFKSGGRKVVIKGAIIGPVILQKLREKLDPILKINDVTCDFIDSKIEIQGSLHPSIGSTLGVEPVTDTDEPEQQFAAHVGVPDEVRKRAEWAADIVGVTKYSDMRVHVVQAAMTALMNDDRKYFVGDETKRKVFDANNIQNLSNLQEVFDAVERALQPKPAVEPEKQPSAVELHREATKAHIEAEKHAEAIRALPNGFESESREIMVNEYFERQRVAFAASRKTDIQGEGIPDHDDPSIWNDRSVWHYKMRARHSQILRVLTDQ